MGFCNLLKHLSKQVFYRCYGVVKQHPGAAPAHDVFYAFSFAGCVAVDGAFVAGRFIVPKTAARQPGGCILQHFCTFAAKLIIALFMPTVHPHHNLNNLFLFRYTSRTHSFQNKVYSLLTIRFSLTDAENTTLT